MSTKWFSAVLLGFCFAVLPAFSFQDEELLNMSLEELLEIDVTSASKFAQKTREAPSVITVVPKQQIEDYAFVSLNDILYMQPGFGPGQDFDRPTVPTRGLFDSWSNNHLLHLVDGIPMNDNLYGTAYTWEVTPLFMAKAIEIIRGPGSALYGSNATNGVIQVNTVRAAEMEKNFYFRGRSGSLNTQIIDFMASHETAAFSAVVGFNSYTTDGNEYFSYDGSGRFDEAGNLQQFRTRDRRKNSYLWAKIEGENSLKGLSLQYHEQRWDFNTGHGWLWWVPDYLETMPEKRRIVSLKYAPEPKGNFAQEYVVRYQNHAITWNQRYYPDGAFEDYYPSGMWEFLDTDADDVFVRAQFAWRLAKEANFLVGFEGDRFIYNGDEEHFSNVNVDSPFFEPFPGDVNTPLGPWLDFILDHPLINTGLYSQFSSGNMISEKFRVTAGVRWDELRFDYDRIYEEGRPEASKSFSRVSPRLAAVYLPNDKMTFKFMAGKAFRAPTPTELAGAHTFSLASNIEELKPELITTVELAMDWKLNPNVNVRGNLFQTEFENQIAYSTQNNNLSTNVFSQETRGLELEVLAQKGNFGGFANLSLTDRLDENVLDNTIAANPDEVTWEPSEKLNFGVTWRDMGWLVALSGHYHGEVKRRDSDVGAQELPLGVGVVLDMDAYRDRELDAWFTLDSHVQYSFSKDFKVGLTTKNLLDTDDNQLVKTGPFPFDYQGYGRRIDVYLQIDF